MSASSAPPASSGSHWAAAGAPVVTSPPPDGSLAGGALKGPPCSAFAWDWELRTAVVPSGDAPLPVAPADEEAKVTHRGGCHCGSVRFEVVAPATLVCYDCNCSDCRMRRNLHFVVRKPDLRFVQDTAGGAAGAAALSEYRWGTGAARHLFCSRCGVTPLYVPRSNPNGWAVTFQCLDPGTCSAVEVRQFDGVHWEEHIAGEGASIRSFSS